MRWEDIAQARSILAAEEGTIYKDWGGKLAVALAYPNTYYVGMSSLGLQTVYRLLNEQPDIVCERVFWPGTGKGTRGGELISLESQRPLDDFSVLAFSISYEMDYFNVVQMLRQANIPPLAANRDESHPLLVAGGPAPTANPEPLALLLDALVIGEGEAVLPPLLDTLREKIGGERSELLAALALLPGLYVPHVHRAPAVVRRAWVRDLDDYPATSIVLTRDTEFGDLYLMEISRGCGRGCHFCLAGRAYRPLRERSVDVLLAQAKEGLRHRERIGLVSAAVSDYSPLDELLAGLADMKARLAVSSLRLDSLSENLARALAESEVQTLTLAPEAGSERLRTFINKRISDDQVFNAVELAAAYQFPQLKLYFMLGLPSESEEDVQAIVDLSLALRQRFPRNIIVNLTPFVPKAHTSFQRVAMLPAAIIEERLSHVEGALRPEGIAVKADSPAWAAVQGVLARGDRQVGQALVRVKRRSLAAWQRASQRCGLEESDYLRERSPDEPLPWFVVRM